MNCIRFDPTTPVVGQILVFSGELEKADKIQQYWNIEDIAERRGLRVMYFNPLLGNWTGQSGMTIATQQIEAVNKIAFADSVALPGLPTFEFGYSDGAVEVMKRAVWWALATNRKLAGSFAYAGHLRYRPTIQNNSSNILLARNNNDITISDYDTRALAARWKNSGATVMAMQGAGKHLDRVDQTLLPAIEAWVADGLDRWSKRWD